MAGSSKGYLQKDLHFHLHLTYKGWRSITENWEAISWGNLCPLIQLNPESRLPLVPLVWTPNTLSSSRATLPFTAEVKAWTKVPFLLLPLWSGDKMGLPKDLKKFWVQSEGKDRGSKKYEGTQQFSSSTANMPLMFWGRAGRTAEGEGSKGLCLRSSQALSQLPASYRIEQQPLRVPEFNLTFPWRLSGLVSQTSETSHQASPELCTVVKKHRWEPVGPWVWCP